MLLKEQKANFFSRDKHFRKITLHSPKASDIQNSIKIIFFFIIREKLAQTQDNADTTFF
jgi:hypothetical protein